eukprot:CAMPEP_0194199258 /NCGR_PEP_ID=MMETSP0156-20130528/343_1 /TAXON_ID=33649 /ORGANISM="Thalassionema nitzschioides, Strain L26-B" /LENGTH=78 /DNA_ID=CAMNT_0038924129 /DNA_START=85 /DNA_END=321 /DNA_ORIENTATION=-
MTTTTFHVGMTCGGCSSAVTRILGKLDGVEKVNPNLETKEVEVTYDEGKVSPKDMFEKLQAWSKASGKEVRMMEELTE